MIRKVLTAAAALWVVALAASCSSSGESTAPPAAKAAPAATAAVTPAVLEKGRALYKANCAPCHGEGGRGDGPGAGVMKPPPRDHTDRAYMSTLTDEELAKVIQMGGGIKGKPLMPGNPQIRGDALAALVAYTRSLSAAGATTP
jgi:mono/diheme cytochrome c family protein